MSVGRRLFLRLLFLAVAAAVPQFASFDLQAQSSTETASDLSEGRDEYYCGLDQPSQWVTLQHASTSMRTYRQAASVNPYSAIALFSARTELSTGAEPNRFSLGGGTMILEKSFSRSEVIRGIEAETSGQPVTDLGSSLPPNSFITVISERAPELDNPITGEPGGFRISAYMENTEGHRTSLGEPAIVLVAAPRKLVAGTGESVEIFVVNEVVSASPR